MLINCLMFKVHVVLDEGDKNDYTKILNKMKDIF